MKLLEPSRIGSMTLRNRVFMAPMGTTSEPDGSLHDRSIRYYEERAKGGFGLIITGANQVSTAYEQKACNVLGSERSLNQLGFLARRIHHNGAKLCVQLTPRAGSHAAALRRQCRTQGGQRRRVLLVPGPDV